VVSGAEWQHNVPAYHNTIHVNVCAIYYRASSMMTLSNSSSPSSYTHYVALTHCCHEARFDDYVVIL